MKSQGGGVVIDVVNKAGEVWIHGSDEDAQDAIKQIEVIREERLEYGPTTSPYAYRLFARAKNEEIDANVASFHLDDDNRQIVVCGTKEQVNVLLQMIEEFMCDHHTEDVMYCPGHESSLLKSGLLDSLKQEFEISVNVNRFNNTISLRGQKEKVVDAKARLEQFIYGGSGYSIVKLELSKEVIGTKFDNKGFRLKELEKKHGGVLISIEPVNGLVTMRGKEKAVLECRKKLLQALSSTQVKETFQLSSRQHAELSRSDVIRSLTADIPVRVTMTDDEVTVRGMFADARCALALLKAHLTDVYETHVELDYSQYAKISTSFRDPSHFNQVKEFTSTQIELSPSSNSIVIRGKRGNVKEAKMLLLRLLDSLLPSNFEHIEIPKVFQSTVASATLPLPAHP